MRARAACGTRQELFETDSHPSILYYDQLRQLPAGRRAPDGQQPVEGAGKRPLVQHVTIGATVQSFRPPADAAAAAAAQAAAKAGGAASAAASRPESGAPRKKSKWDTASKATNLAAGLGAAMGPSISMPSTGVAALDFARISQLQLTKK